MRIQRLVAALLLTAPSSIAAQPPAFSADDMLGIVEFVRDGEPVLAPSGDLVAYVTADVTTDANVRAPRPTGLLWVAALSGGEPRRVTTGHERGDAPAWAPDGRQLAFILTANGSSRVAVWEGATGRVRTIGPPLGTDRGSLPLGSIAPVWMPDGRRLVVAVPEPPDPAAEKPRVRVIRSTDPIVPGDARFTDARQWTLVTLDVASGKTRPLTRPVALRSFQVAPDGRHILYRSVSPETLGRFRKEETRDWIVPVSGTDQPRVATGDRRIPWVVFGPTGETLLFPEGSTLSSVSISDGTTRVVARKFPERTEQPRLAAETRRLALLASRSDTGPADSKMYSILRPTQDVLVVDLTSGRIETVTDRGREDEIGDLQWSNAGRTLFYRTVDPVTYRESIVRWERGGAVRSVVAGDEALSAPSVSSDGTRLVFLASSSTRPADAYAISGSGDRRTRITNLNPQLEAFRFVAPELFEFYSADGVPLRGLLYRPIAASPVPVVTFVYEKLTPQKNRFNPEAQMHVAHGYAYLMPDVLVKPGYTGESFVKSVVPAVNAVRAMGFTTGRFGITGGSFGGYAGLFLISQVDVFAAAVVRAPPSEFFSTWGDGRDRDIWTIETGQARTGGTPWEVPERYIANSPFFFADRVRTPVLIMHGEKDFTVPLQQGEMMFYALRALGRTAELVLYREGDHSIVRGSRSDFLDFYSRMFAWWDRYLRPRGAESAMRRR